MESLQIVVEIREIAIDQSSGIAELNEINAMLKNGWYLIAIHQRGYSSDGDGFYSSVYILGRKD